MRADARCTLSRHVGRAIGSAVAEDSVLSHRRSVVQARARVCDKLLLQKGLKGVIHGTKTPSLDMQ